MNRAAALRCALPSVFRGRWRGVVVLTILIGVAGGSVMTAWEGARRTQSALPRMLHTTRAADVSVSANVDITRLSQLLDTSGLASLPGVAKAGTLYGFGLAPWNSHTVESQDFGWYSTAPGDESVGRTYAAPLLIAGRFPSPRRAGEVVVNDAALDQLRKSGFASGIGAHVPLAWFNFTVLGSVAERLGNRQPTPEELHRVFHLFDGRIVGRVRLPSDVGANENQSQPAILLGPAFARAHARDASYSIVSVVLRDPSQLEAFEAAARVRYPSAGLRFSAPGDLLESFTAITQPYVDAMRLFALVAAITATLVLAQALVRQARAGAGDATTLRSLGMSRPDLSALICARGVVTVVAGTCLAMVTAVGLSAWFPIGPARVAEPHPGVRADPYVLVAGSLAMLVVLLATVAFTGVHIASTADRGASRVKARRARRVIRRGPSLAADLGLARAFDGSGLTGASVGVTFVGVVIAIATCAAAIGFGSALDGFVSHPVRWGWHWDAMYDTYETGLDPSSVAVLRQLPQADGVTIGTRGTITIGQSTISAFGLDVLRGDASPMLLEGRLPSTRNEIALGSRAARDLRTHVGARIAARDVNGARVELQVVGRAVIPPSLDLSETHRLGQGAILTSAGLAAIDPAPKPSFALVNLRDRSRSSFTAVSRSLPTSGSLLGAQRPGEVTSYSGVRSTPRFLALLLALLGIGVLAHVLISSTRARRREFALLKAIGCRRRQIASSVMWEATALTGAAALLGLFFGVIASRLMWHRFTEDLGVRAPGVVPFGAWAVAVAALIVLANLIALVPARRSARLTVTKVLRSE
jgi:hypothetical protein